MGSRAASFACLLALTVAGCGTADREADAGAAAQRFHAALEQGDGQAACDQLNAETASKLEKQEKQPCAEAILSLELPKGGTVADTRVYVTSAFTTLADGRERLPRRGSKRLAGVGGRVPADRAVTALRLRAGELRCERCS